MAMDRSASRLEALRAAIAQDGDPGHRLAHAATLDLLDRASRVGAQRPLPGWEPFPKAATAIVGQPGWTMTVAVMANLLAVADFGEPVDFLTFSRLVQRYGHGPVAAVQSTVDDVFATSPSKPLATRFAWQVARTTEVVDGLVASGLDREKATEVGGRCQRGGFWLVVTDVDPDAPGPELTTVDDVVRCADKFGLPGWRGQAARVAANPWAPYPAKLHKLLVDHGRPELAAALEELIQHYRDLSEQRDRQLVAREIRRLVAVSGLSQRQFAALCGTSAPRLSTYVNGLVTPSASMMLRLARVSERAQRQSETEHGSTA